MPSRKVVLESKSEPARIYIYIHTYIHVYACEMMDIVCNGEKPRSEKKKKKKLHYRSLLPGCTCVCIYMYNQSRESESKRERERERERERGGGEKEIRVGLLFVGF